MKAETIKEKTSRVAFFAFVCEYGNLLSSGRSACVFIYTKFLKELEKERGQNGKPREGCDRGGRIRNVHKFGRGVIDGESGKQMGGKFNLPLVEEKRV